MGYESIGGRCCSACGCIVLLLIDYTIRIEGLAFRFQAFHALVVKYASTSCLGRGRACSTASPTAFCAILPKSRGVHVRSQHGETWFVGLEETPEGGEGAS